MNNFFMRNPATYAVACSLTTSLSESPNEYSVKRILLSSLFSKWEKGTEPRKLNETISRIDYILINLNPLKESKWKSILWINSAVRIASVGNLSKAIIDLVLSQNSFISKCSWTFLQFHHREQLTLFFCDLSQEIEIIVYCCNHQW